MRMWGSLVSNRREIFTAAIPQEKSTKTEAWLAALLSNPPLHTSLTPLEDGSFSSPFPRFGSENVGQR